MPICDVATVAHDSLRRARVQGGNDLRCGASCARAEDGPWPQRRRATKEAALEDQGGKVGSQATNEGRPPPPRLQRRRRRRQPHNVC